MTLQEAYELLGGDLRETMARLNDRALLVRHLRQFPGDSEWQRLRRAVMAGDRGEAWQAAHALCGTCGMLGLNHLAAATERVMEATEGAEQREAMALLEQEHRYAVAVIELLEDRDTVLAMLVHELRTPLQAILGTAEPRQGEAGMSRIMLAARHLSALLSGLEELAMERPLCRNPCSLEETLHGAVELLQDTADMNRPRIEVQTDIRHERVLGDATCLTQILLNLLLNAIRHAPESDTILLKATQTDEGVELSVTDHGAGMTEQERQCAFVPYWRADEKTGMGLGFPIVRGLTERMGGRLRLDSAPGEGTTVTLYLPLAASDAVENQGEPVEKARRFDGLRALLAEDDRTGAEVSAELLEGLGLRTSVAHDGREAVRMARTGGYDCVFLDAHMPGMDALSALSGIRQALPEAPVFALTAGVSREEAERLLLAGTRECLLKPVGAQQIMRLLSAYFPDR